VKFDFTGLVSLIPMASYHHSRKKELQSGQKTTDFVKKIKPCIGQVNSNEALTTKGCGQK
jgi:hypothetical protein